MSLLEYETARSGQLSYHFAEALFISEGSWIHIVSYFGDVPHNPFNSDPSATVTYCVRADCEMMEVQFKHTLTDEHLTEHTRHLARRAEEG